MCAAPDDSSCRTSPRSATTTTASTGTSTSTARSRSRPRPPASSSSGRPPRVGEPPRTEIAPGVFAPVHQHLFSARTGRRDRRRGQPPRRDRRRAHPDGPGQRVRQRLHVDRDAAAHRARGAARRRHLGRPRVGGASLEDATTSANPPRTTCCLAADGSAHGRPRPRRRRARRVRDQAPVGDGVRPRGTVAERPVPERPSGRGGTAGVHLGEPLDRRRRPRRCGTRSVSRTSRAPRTGRSCRWTTPASGSSRTGSWT